MKAIRVYVLIEAQTPFTEYTGRLTKTIIYWACQQLQLIHGLRGIVSPIHVSPLFKPGRNEWKLGERVTPFYRVTSDHEYELVPVNLSGTYLFHIGGDNNIIECINKGLSKLMSKNILMRFNNTNISITIENIIDVTDKIIEKNIDSDKVTIYFKAPTKLFNPYGEARLISFLPKALDVLATPYLLLTKQSYSTQIFLQLVKIAAPVIETWYTINTIKPIHIPFAGKREPALTGKATYIIHTKDENTIKHIEILLQIAEIAGIGESRLNGFGTITWTTKP